MEQTIMASIFYWKHLPTGKTGIRAWKEYCNDMDLPFLDPHEKTNLIKNWNRIGAGKWHYSEEPLNESIASPTDYPKFVSNHFIVDLLHKVHTQIDFDDSFWDRVQGEYYQLKPVKVSALQRINDIDMEADYYSDLSPASAPPIVVTSKGKILDGFHRVSAAIARGESTIRAYVPVPKKDWDKAKSMVAESYYDEVENYPICNRQYRFETDCVSSDAKSINDMCDMGKEVSYTTIKKYCDGLRQWELSMGYQPDGKKGLTLKNDYAVRFFKSKYRGKPCLFIMHSAIEYVWVKN